MVKASDPGILVGIGNRRAQNQIRKDVETVWKWCDRDHRQTIRKLAAPSRLMVHGEMRDMFILDS